MMQTELPGFDYQWQTFGATMNEKVAAALARIKQALEGKEPANVTVQTGEDRDGNPVYGERTPWAQVLAGDTLLVAESIPKDKRTRVVKDLRTGVFELPAETPVHQQTQCLLELVREAEAVKPAADKSAGG